MENNIIIAILMFFSTCSQNSIDTIKGTSIENNIIEEAALELAFEGNRWGDLVRVAMHRNDPSFLADKVYAKLAAEGNPEANSVRARLMSRQNWFLPFRWNTEDDE